MRICPKCRSNYDDDARHCPVDGFRPVLRADWLTAGSDPLLGSTLADRYTLVGKLGAGGMGTVYRAEQSPIGREVALKVLRRDLGHDPETVGRFYREGQTLSQLKHPNTVTIFDFGQTDDGLLYLAMELLEGEMLSARLRRAGAGAVEVEHAIRIAAGVLRSLDEAHTRGIIHRDLKPDNIFLARVHARPDEDEIVKVVDFGIAKIRHGDGPPGLDPIATQEGTVFGTPRYMSPEQAQGKTLDGRSDLYAVGVLLFHMLTGDPPFTDDDAVIVMAHHIKTVPQRVRSGPRGPGIPASLDRLVARALEKSPDARPQSAQDFLTALEATAGDLRAVQNAALLPVETSVFPASAASPRSFALVLGAVALLTVVSLSFFTPGHRRAPAPQRAAATTGVKSLSVANTLNLPGVPIALPSNFVPPGPALPEASAQEPAAREPTLGEHMAGAVGAMRAAVSSPRAPRTHRAHRAHRAPAEPAVLAPTPSPEHPPRVTPSQPYPRWREGELK